MPDIETIRVVLPPPKVIRISALPTIIIAGTLELPFTTDFMRIKATGEFQLWNSDQSKYHTLKVQGGAGSEYITIGAGES